MKERPEAVSADEESLARLYDAAHVVCRSEADTPDLAHEVWLLVREQGLCLREVIAHESRFAALVYNTWRRGTTHRRFQQRAIPLHELGDRLMPRAFDPRVLERIDALDLKVAMARLPPPFQETVRLVSEEGLSYAASAAVQGCPVNTIRSRAARGLALVAAHLAGARSADQAGSCVHDVRPGHRSHHRR